MSDELDVATQWVSTVRKAASWATDGAWISGVVGALTVVVTAIWYHKSSALEDGVSIAGWLITDTRIDSLLLALAIVATAMVLTEFLRLCFWDARYRLSLSPNLRKPSSALNLVAEATLSFLLYLLALWLIQQFFSTANEFGFAEGAPYYQPWFRLLEIALSLWLWAGLPYCLLTRALKFDLQADKLDYGWFLGRLLKAPLHYLLPRQFTQSAFLDSDKRTARSLLVKLFFTPLMTVFFADQFGHLVNNVGYLSGNWLQALASEEYALSAFNRDLFNVSTSMIFSIDVALAWCGYMISSRWVDNQTTSAEPTTLGWVVCLICYPPFQMALGLYYSPPAERDILSVSASMLATGFTVMMVLSYLIYLSATIYFGVRFSNLTNRGILRKGPYAWVRHPAYMSKNFSWWCVMFPVILLNVSTTGFAVALAQLLGLVTMSYVYYLRAMTEEKHLGVDPAYREYCQQVKYRFIPGLI